MLTSAYAFDQRPLLKQKLERSKASRQWRKKPSSLTREKFALFLKTRRWRKCEECKTNLRQPISAAARPLENGSTNQNPSRELLMAINLITACCVGLLKSFICLVLCNF